MHLRNIVAVGVASLLMVVLLLLMAVGCPMLSQRRGRISTTATLRSHLRIIALQGRTFSLRACKGWHRYGVAGVISSNMALMMMEQHIEDAVALDDVADAVGLSRRQLERLFRTEFGATPVAMYIRLRLEHARRLVVFTDKALIDIALETGFENVSHFIRKFRKEFAITPVAARRRHAAETGA